MTRTIAGLRWDVPSPSFYRLAPEHTRDAIVDVSFVGDMWIMCMERAGEVSTARFKSRDAALAMVEQAFRNEGVI